MSTGTPYGPYVVTAGSDLSTTGPGPQTLEATFVASEQLVDIGNGLGVTTHAEVFNGAIPGPTLRLRVGDTAVVRLINDLPHPTGIHWHGIELENYADGTEVTQDGAVPHFAFPPPAPAPPGGTFLYKFKVTRPGLFWYHPHHHNSSNRVFRGMYGMIIVTDPLEANLTNGVILPAPADTMQVVLSDITVCKAPGSNLNATLQDTTYDDPTTLLLADRPEWLSGVTAQNGTSPKQLCEIAPAGSAVDDDGNLIVAPGTSYNAGDVPSIVREAILSEGQTVLTNGVNVGGRFGTPDAPRALVPGVPAPKNVQSGQGLRLQIVNCAHLRYFRLRLTYNVGANPFVQVPLVRIGGEGGLLDNAILEGGFMGTLDTDYFAGEILLPPATRADVVAAMPADSAAGTLPVGTVLTLWTRDYKRTGGGVDPNRWSQLPSVPVMHFVVTGPKPGAPYTIVGQDDNASPPVVGTPLRGPATGLPVAQQMPLVENIKTPATTGTLLNPTDPAQFSPAKTGLPLPNQDIKMTTSGGIPRVDNIPGLFTFPPGSIAPPVYAHLQHLGSTRYAEAEELLELTVTNSSNAHHPFHLHGFSFQPKSLAPRATPPPLPVTLPIGSYTWQYQEFRDTIDLPPHHTLTFRVRLDARNLADDVTPGGALGRWLFHCHIFFHHHQGMISELVVVSQSPSPPDLYKEKPNVKVGGSWAYASLPGGTTERKGSFFHPDGLVVGLTATLADGTPFGAISYPAGVSSGNWTWTLDTAVGPPAPPVPAQTQYVYITATDSEGRKDQAVFRVKLGAPDDGADIGDPHIHTVDGTNYDFQAAGEFILLRDREEMEIQVRQTPVETPPPITDGYSGLTACVSLNTAVAARVGSHRIAFQPARAARDPQAGQRFFVDGKPALLTSEGIDLDGHRVSGFEAGDEMGLRVDYMHGPVLLVTPHLWTSYGIRYLDVSVLHTQADEGIMGRIPKNTWLPALPSGATLGPKPANLHDRYVALYRTFADAWRVTDQTSLFVYLPGTSTGTFTDRDWPPEQPPCTLKPEFQKPVTPILKNIELEKAERICRNVTDEDLHANCVFDVATTGDKSFAKGYLIAQDLRHQSTAVQIFSDKLQTQHGELLTITAVVMPLTVLPMMYDGLRPKGTVTFLVDGVPASSPVRLNRQGRAAFKTDRLEIGDHVIRAVYSGGGRPKYYPSSSPNLLHTVGEKTETPQDPHVPEPHGAHM